MSDSPPAGPPYSVDSLGARPLTQAFHTVSGTGEPGTDLIVDLQASPWGTLDPVIGSPEFAFGGEYRAPEARPGSPADQVVTVGDDGTWSLDFGEVPDGQYWIVVQDLEGRSPAVTTELQVWSSPDDRILQNPDESLLATGPPQTTPAPSGRLENEEFAVDAQADPDLTQSFHTVSGTGRPGTEIVVDVSATSGSGAPGGGAAESRGGAGEHVVTVTDDGTWTIDLGELPDGEFQIDVSLGAGRLHTETQTIQVWSSPGHRIEQQRANGVYVPPERPTKYIAPDGTIFPENEPPVHQEAPAPKSGSDILSRVDVPFRSVFAGLQNQLGEIPLAVVVRTDTLARIEVPVQLSGDTITPVSSIADMAAGEVDALIVSIELGAEQLQPVSLEFIGDGKPPMSTWDEMEAIFEGPLTDLSLDEIDPDELWGERDGLGLDLVGLESDLVPGVTIATSDAPRIVRWFDVVEETGQGAFALLDDPAAPFAAVRVLADSVAGSVPAAPAGLFAFGTVATASTGTEGWEGSLQPATMTTTLEPSLTEAPFITGFETVATSHNVAVPFQGRRRDVLVGGGLLIIVFAVGTFLLWPGGDNAVVIDDPGVLVDSDEGSLVPDGTGPAAVDSGAVSGGDDGSSVVDSGSVGEDDPPPLPPGLHPQAHAVSAVPVVMADGTYGIVVIFSQPLDGVPELFSYFVRLDFIAGVCTFTFGGEIHAGTITSFGPTFLLADGSMFAETGCPIEPGATARLAGQSGSWVTEFDSVPGFADIAFEFGPDEVVTDSAPFDTSQAVPLFDDGRPPLPPGLEGFEIAGASNDGSGKITINFAGPVKALVEGDAYIVDIRAEASEDGIRVIVTQRNIGGELIPNGSTINDADAVNGTIAGKGVDTVWEWPADNQVVVIMVSTEGVPIPTSQPTVTVTVSETGSTDEFTFTN